MAIKAQLWRALKQRSRSGAGMICASFLALTLIPATAQATGISEPLGVETTVLVVDDGSPMLAAMADRLGKEGIRTEVVALGQAGREQLDSDFFTSQRNGSTVGRFAAVVLPTDVPAGLSEQERAELNAYEVTYGARQVSMYDWANPTLGLNYAADPGYMGAVDGLGATITANGKDNGFGYLRGSLSLDDIDPAVSESYGYLATPLQSDPDEGVFTPLVTATIPGTTAQGSLIGQYEQGGRERLIITFASNQYQQHFKVLSHGIINWLTRGVSTSFNRNYLSVHSDDLFMSDAKWSIPGNCTIGDGCDPQQYPQDAPGATVRMDGSDIDRLTTWQRRTGLKIDQAFNGAGAVEYMDEHQGQDPLLQASTASAKAIRWISHTFTHEFMGCQQTSNTPPWSCLTDGQGKTLWYPFTTARSEISKNLDFAQQHSLPLDAAELVSGEHSGLKTLPQQPVDNPEFIRALNSEKIAWIASDASRESAVRQAGNALTVPRYPMNLYYNVSTEQELAAEFNWIYTTAADGGSGLCEANPETSTCIEPLDLDRGFDEYIRPLEARVMLGHVVDNDARPHFAHQSNLADDAVIYPVMDDVLQDYQGLFAANAELINPTMTEAGQALLNQQQWKQDQTKVSSLINGKHLVIRNTSGSTVKVPVTAPEGTTTAGGTAFGQSYAGERSAWVELAAGQSLQLNLPQPAPAVQPEVDAVPDAPSAPMPKRTPNTTVIVPPAADSEVIDEALEVAP